MPTGRKLHLNAICTVVIPTYIHLNFGKKTQSVRKSKSQHHDFILSGAIFHEWRGKSHHTCMENARKPTSTTILSKAEQNGGNTSQRNQHKCEPSEGGDLEVGLERRAVIARRFSH
jgi:hypothetical protein